MGMRGLPWSKRLFDANQSQRHGSGSQCTSSVPEEDGMTSVDYSVLDSPRGVGPFISSAVQLDKDA